MTDYKITLVKSEDGTPDVLSIGDNTVRFQWVIKDKSDKVVATPFSDMSIADVKDTEEFTADTKKKIFKDMGKDLLEQYVRKVSTVASRESEIRALKNAFTNLGDVSSTKARAERVVPK